MTSDINYDDYSPGHLNLPVNINENFDNEVYGNSSGNENESYKSNQRDLHFRYESLNNDVFSLISHTAIENLKGLLAFRMGNYELSVEHFESVIEVEEDNVNSLQNLAHSYNKMNMKQKSDEMTAIVKALLGRSENLKVSHKLVNHRVACSLAEQALTYAYDVTMTEDDVRVERLEESITVFDRAINISSSSLSKNQKKNWLYFMLVILVKIDNLLIKNVHLTKCSPSKRLSLYNRAINISKELCKSEVHLIKSTAHALLGVLLERQSDFNNTPISIHDCGYTAMHSMTCFSKAIEIAEKKPQVLNQLSKIFHSNNKHELALATANMSIEVLENSRVPVNEKNVVSYQTRANIYTNMYMKDFAKNKVTEYPTMPDRELLLKARDDLEKVILISPSLQAYVDIGQTSYYIGADAISEDIVVDEDSINCALVYFSEALDCPMGKSLPELQILRGKCMKIRGEDDNALECFKQAAVLERKGSTNDVIFKYMINCYFSLFNQCDKSDEEKLKEITKEVEQWLQCFFKRFNHRILKSCLRDFAHQMSEEWLQLCKLSIMHQRYFLTKTTFEMFNPENQAS